MGRRAQRNCIAPTTTTAPTTPTINADVKAAAEARRLWETDEPLRKHWEGSARWSATAMEVAVEMGKRLAANAEECVKQSEERAAEARANGTGGGGERPARAAEAWERSSGSGPGDEPTRAAEARQRRTEADLEECQRVPLRRGERRKEADLEECQGAPPRRGREQTCRLNTLGGR